MRTGVFGGTFDPPHIGHVASALEVGYRLELDRVLMVVANDPWQKSGDRCITDADARLALVRLAIDGLDNLVASDIEIRRGGESYSVDTLQHLKEADPDDHLFLLVGSDAAAGLLSWKHPGELMELATTVLMRRGGRGGSKPPQDWPHVSIDVPALEISSSDLRNRFREGRPVEALMRRSVVSEIRRLGLYGATR